MATPVLTEPQADAAATSLDLGRSRGRVLRSLLHNPLGLVGAGLLLLVVIVAVFAPLLAPYSPTQVHFETPFQRVGTKGFWLGTDDLGRDVMSRVFYGTRASLQVGVLSVA
ncbi:MAG: ABC transporter permease, partial [Propionibacteriaceae bacterium]